MENKKKQILGAEGYIAIFTLLCLAMYTFLYFYHPLRPYSPYPLYAALAVGGIPLIYNLLRKIFLLEFSSDLLAGISIVASVALAQYLAGTLVVLMLSGGAALERYAVRVASRVLEAVAKRAPKNAHRKRAEDLEEISVEEIAIGDILTVFPHEICPVDGEVIEGSGVMDESYLTGEPFLISKTVGSTVLSGAINGESSITIKALKVAGQSRYAKILEVLKETQVKRPRIRRLADQLGAWYTPLAIIIAVLAWAISGDAIRFLAVLVIATPCPLLIAIPVAIIGSISLSARQGILIKNPVVLEQFDQCKTLILDKTGTLTYGKPFLTETIFFEGFKEKEVLQLAASLERYSKHPLAGAILDKAEMENVQLVQAEKIMEPKGEGLRGTVRGHAVVITNRSRLAQFGLEDRISLLPQGTGLECIVLLDHKLAAYFRFRDAPRKESAAFIRHLPLKHSFKKIMIVSGDREEEVRYLAGHVGISEVHAGKSPEDKVKIVEKERLKTKTAFLGDGINDAPALMAATVGIAFGQNSDITAESAGAVIMENSFVKVDEFLHISQRMRKIALQSAIGGMALSILGMAIAAFGILVPVAGAIAQEVIDLLAIFNSLRTLLPPSSLSDISGFPSKSPHGRDTAEKESRP